MTGSRRLGSKARAWGAAVSDQAREWAERQDPTSRRGVAIDAWRRYREVDGPLQSALLALYILVAVLPALIVFEEYLDKHPAALANHLVDHYGLNGATARLLHDVLANTRTHELGSALLAIVGALIFGLGFGHVLQLVHSRAWRLPTTERYSDQALYALVLAGVYGLILLLLVQLSELQGDPAWVGPVLALGWVAVLAGFFTLAPWLLLHKQVTRRDLVPAGVLTAVGLVALMLVSSFVMEFWINLYARDYGGFGVVLAIYFWLAFSSFVIVAAASLGPSLTQRRTRAD
jgi:membrane protein